MATFASHPATDAVLDDADPRELAKLDTRLLTQMATAGEREAYLVGLPPDRRLNAEVEFIRGMAEAEREEYLATMPREEAEQLWAGLWGVLSPEEMDNLSASGRARWLQHASKEAREAYFMGDEVDAGH